MLWCTVGTEERLGPSLEPPTFVLLEEGVQRRLQGGCSQRVDQRKQSSVALMIKLAEGRRESKGFGLQASWNQPVVEESQWVVGMTGRLGRVRR